MEENNQKVSKYNSGVAIIMRLDNLWKDTHNHSRQGLFNKWNADLDRIWCELARDLKDSEYNDKKSEDGKKIYGYKSKFDSFDDELSKVGRIIDSEPQGFESVSKESLKDRNNQYKILMEKELFLRRLENHLGKGTAWDDDDEDGFD